MDVRTVGSDHLTRDLLADFYDTVLAPSFPRTELVSREDLLAALDADGTAVTVAVDEADDVVGGAVGQWFPECRVMLTEYLAARPGRRGKGVGRTVLRAVLADWIQRFDPLLVLGEVEDPEHHGDTGYGDPVRRLRFYRGEGAEIVAAPYFQPALHGAGTRVPHLLLMAFAVSGECRTGTGIAAAPVRCFVEHNLAACEGSVGDDEQTRALLGALAGETVALSAPDIP